MKLFIEDIGYFELPPETPLKSILEEIKKNSPNKELPIAFLTPSGETLDWHTPIQKNHYQKTNAPLVLKPLFTKEKKAKEVLRHTASHVLAQAVKELFPEARLGIGPATEEGFYYDIYHSRPFTEEDLPKIERKMKEIIVQNLTLEREELGKEEAKRLFAKLEEKFKLELIEELPEGEISLYRQGNFVDLCRGPHLLSTGLIKAVKLLSVSGAYWRGNEKNPMLWRIYGTAFFSEQELEEYLNWLEEVKKRDHRRLGQELELFTIEEDIGPGLVIWLPKGALIRKIIEDFWKEEHLKRGYQILYTPHVALLDLWKTSGHLDFYRENMFPPMELENRTYQLKPMNCPFHIYVYKQKRRSYRELPLRFCELGTVYRFERSGVLHGLLRVRGFTQDDAHIFCREENLKEELINVLQLVLYFLKLFGFKDYQVYLSTRPEKFVGDPRIWDLAEKSLQETLEELNLPYEIDPGEGVFYGPKIDLKIKDTLGRFWQCSTVQVDFNLPERFDLVYVGEDNRFHRPIMIHRALLGSLERFLGVLIEHYAGAFPFWLSPVQIKILTVKDSIIPYGQEITSLLRKEGFRVEEDYRNEKLNYKIRTAQLEKVPYMIILGEKEAQNRTVSLRSRKGEVTNDLSLEDLIAKLKVEANPSFS